MRKGYEPGGGGGDKGGHTSCLYMQVQEFLLKGRWTHTEGNQRWLNPVFFRRNEATHLR